MKQKYLRADELAELFRDMSEFAETDEARRGLLAAARTVDELPGVWLEEGTAAGETGTNVRGGTPVFRTGNDIGFRNGEGYADPTAYRALSNLCGRRRDG